MKYLYAVFIPLSIWVEMCMSASTVTQAQALANLQKIQAEIATGVIQPAQPAGVQVNVKAVNQQVAQVLTEHGRQTHEKVKALLAQENLTHAQKDEQIKQIHEEAKPLRKAAVDQTLKSLIPAKNGVIS